jgi:hypothetical protein
MIALKSNARATARISAGALIAFPDRAFDCYGNMVPNFGIGIGIGIEIPTCGLQVRRRYFFKFLFIFSIGNIKRFLECLECFN